MTKSKLVWIISLSVLIMTLCIISFANHQKNFFNYTQGAYCRQFGIINDEIERIINLKVDPAEYDWEILGSLLNVENRILVSIIEAEIIKTKVSKKLLNLTLVKAYDNKNERTYAQSQLQKYIRNTNLAYNYNKDTNYNFNIDDFNPYDSSILPKVLKIRKELYVVLQSFHSGSKRQEFYNKIIEAETQITEIIATR